MSYLIFFVMSYARKDRSISLPFDKFMHLRNSQFKKVSKIEKKEIKVIDY